MNLKTKQFQEKLNLLRLDDSNYKEAKSILINIIEKRSTINEKYNIYYIENGNLIYDNLKYLVE